MSVTDSGRVVVLAGGLSHERDVSIRSGRRVAEALRHRGMETEERDLDANLLPALRADPPAAVIPMLHGAAGEDGAIRDILDMLDLPYVGSGPVACRRAFDKPVAKGLIEAAGLATPLSFSLPHATFRELGAQAILDLLVERVGLPLVIKPVRGGSALGCSIVRDATDLPQAMVACFAYGETALAEAFVEGTEVAISVIDTDDGPRALPAVEIVPDGGFYDYAARYTAGSTEFFVPARLPAEAMGAAVDLALAAHDVLGLRDFSRTDMIVDGSGRAWFLEVNVAPGMTETSLLPQAAAAEGLDLGSLMGDLVTRALARAVPPAVTVR